MTKAIADQLRAKVEELTERNHAQFALISERDTQLEAERSAVAGLSEQLERERQVTAHVVERANAAEIAAAELKGGIKAIQAATFALLGEMSFGGQG